ncbi:transposase [Sulfobacillus thermosulfidooxidans]|uniref:Transposase n=1 Tax=Sulfobacillus thermosulfidooxidans (strain DSM 9293 / VKM B-1269 / AT-1) TaxID=929705 RepID=A0A1W1WER0_SULTA|nr:transposase [Sulfobacillus thermosulfidooxidans]OLZ10219.1 transposase [Sulfobacillus thermosulfidooxidans]OLZ17011.1 transposase [Sulfobacillus thermosulfidooxidans]OLZ20107.1 transposase [Sulfobacillus thermosulfidooxidans]SMC04801.1 Transposase [Sulfobacillus thermosulfidooxidans DSM 9293]SMC05357.1 Transposase [Sulfobacillus thermosulfidooxidans DSM 9293]
MSQTYSPEFKQQIVQEAQDTQNATLVARRHQLSPSMVRRWVREAVKAAHHPHDLMSLVDENERLKKLLGEKDLQIAMLQDLLQKKGIRP